MYSIQAVMFVLMIGGKSVTNVRCCVIYHNCTQLIYAHASSSFKLTTSYWFRFFSVHVPFFSNREHLSYDGFLKVRGEIIRTVLCWIVYWSYAQSISTLRWAVLLIGFCQTGSILLCIDLFVFVCLYFVFFFVRMSYHCNTVGWIWWD